MDSLRGEDPPFAKVTREVPLWAIITGLVAVVGQAALAQFTLNAQGEAIRQLSAQVLTLTASFDATRMKGVDHDYAIKDLERRLRDLENPRNSK